MFRLLVAVPLFLALLAGCGGNDGSSEEAPTSDSGPTATRVADRYQDTMGFTIVGANRFLGSGHPDAREKLPPFLGLIRSTDAGRSWQEVSLMGKSDFHVLEASGSRVYGFGSNYETRELEFLVSGDGGENWDKRSPPGGLISLAISPDDPEQTVGAIEGGPADDGLYASSDAGRGWQPLTDTRRCTTERSSNPATAAEPGASARGHRRPLRI